MAMIEAAMAPPPDLSFPDSEAHFRALVEQLPVVTYVASLGPNLPATYVSPQIADWGFAPEAWLADPGFWVKQLHADDRERVLAEFERGIAAGGPILSEYRLLDAAGRPRWVKDRAVLIRDAAGRPSAIQGVMLDIDERKRSEAEAAQHLAQLQAQRRRMETAIEEERRRIAREVHDELGQALTALKLELALPEREPEVEPARATALFRIFQEILTNIARHAGASQVDVCATAAMGNLLIEVDDDGRGFDPSSPEAAASLGLLGMRERAAEFGGLVSIHSEPGRGTRVTLALPMIPSP